MANSLSVIILFLGLSLIPFKNFLISKNHPSDTEFQKSFKDTSIVYKTENLIIKKLSNHIYQHISYLQTDDFGKVSCNGMVVLNNSKVIIFDTPTEAKSSLELINYFTKKLNTKITAVIPTHFHEDCVGGLKVFEKHDIQLYATNQTLKLLKQEGHEFSKPVNAFNNHLELALGAEKIYAKYFGEGHTKDNIIGYSVKDNAIFGGCLIKTVGAKKGNLEDANTNQWSATVIKLKLEYPNAKIVIPGHGKHGGSELLDYTIELFN